MYIECFECLSLRISCFAIAFHFLSIFYYPILILSVDMNFYFYSYPRIFLRRYIFLSILALSLMSLLLSIRDVAITRSLLTSVVLSIIFYFCNKRCYLYVHLTLFFILCLVKTEILSYFSGL